MENQETTVENQEATDPVKVVGLKLKKRPKTLRANRSAFAAHMRNEFHVEPAESDTAEDLLRAEYWLHMSPKPKAGDKVEILWEGGGRYAEAIVLDSNSKGVSIAYVIKPVDIGDIMPVEDDDRYAVKWAGPHAKHRVHRISDGEIMKDGFDSKPAAQRYIMQTLKAS